jgi:hypothetical protein
MSQRVHYRATVQAGLQVPQHMLVLHLRGRAATTSGLEPQPGLNSENSSSVDQGGTAIAWTTAETGGTYAYPHGGNTKKLVAP